LRRRPAGEPFVTDEGNYVLDCAFRAIEDPASLARRLESLPGVMAHGLFIGMAELAIIGGESGATVITRGESDAG
jgi:ribose 5-phosphate isomerase A